LSKKHTVINEGRGGPTFQPATTEEGKSGGAQPLLVGGLRRAYLKNQHLLGKTGCPVEVILAMFWGNGAAGVCRELEGGGGCPWRGRPHSMWSAAILKTKKNSAKEHERTGVTEGENAMVSISRRWHPAMENKGLLANKGKALNDATLNIE